VEINGAWPLEILIPKFLTLSEHPSPKMRAHAIACLSFFVPINCQSLFTHIDTFITCLFKRASDEDPSVRRHVCSALVLLLASRPDKLMPEMANVAEYMLYSTKDRNDNVALEACEFWLTFAEDPELAPHLHPLLPKVAPVLLDCMLYSEDDLLWLDAEGEDAAVPDKETDIKPRHYSGKAHGLDHEPSGDASTDKRVGAYGEEIASLDDDEEEYDEEDDFADEMSTEWNLRKCAAAALDVLAVRFGPDLLNVLLEPLKAKLWNDDWLCRESGILALGAMAEGWIASSLHVPQFTYTLFRLHRCS
jgi:transportin-1